MQHDSDEDINIDIDDSVVGVGREGGVRSMHRNGDGESSIDTLLRHWQDERMAPEILQYPAELIDEISDHIDAQQSAIAIITGANGGGGGDANNAPPARRPRRVDSEQHQQILLTELDIERVKWLLGSYLRTRTFKIEKFASYIIKYAGRGVDQLGLDDDDADDAARRNTRLALRKKLSDVELGYAERCVCLLARSHAGCVSNTWPACQDSVTSLRWTF